MGINSGKTKYRKNACLRRQGFTLLFTILIMSIILVIGIGVFEIILKEIVISGAGRESQIAFYAADSGVECSLYWDVKGRVFATSSDSTPPSNNVYCNNIDIAQSWILSDVTPVSATTRFDVSFNNGACVRVFVTKNSGLTTIEGHGFNMACGSSDPRKVERGLRIRY